MKKLLIMVMLAALLCSISIPASAASDTYELDEVGLTVSIPADFSVITRDTPENSSVFSDVGMTKADFMAYFQEYNVYLNAFSASIDEEIIINMTQNDVGYMNLFGDSTLLESAKGIANEFRAIGRDVSKYEIYWGGYIKYIRLYYTDTTTNSHSVQYYTIYNNKAINITLHSYKGSLTSQQEKIAKNIADSALFQVTSSGTASDSNTTKPSDTGTTEANSNPNLNLNTWQDDNQDYTALIVFGAVLVVAGIVALLIVRHKKKKNEYEEMMEFCVELAKPQKPEEKKILCRKCGHMLPQDSVFCHFCGTKIEKES